MIGKDVRKDLVSCYYEHPYRIENELGYANGTNQYIEMAARTFQVDHANDNL